MQEEKNRHDDKTNDRNYDRDDSPKGGWDSGRSEGNRDSEKSADIGILYSPTPWGNPWDKEKESDSDKAY